MRTTRTVALAVAALLATVSCSALSADLAAECEANGGTLEFSHWDTITISDTQQVHSPVYTCI